MSFWCMISSLVGIIIAGFLGVITFTLVVLVWQLWPWIRKSKRLKEYMEDENWKE